MCCMICLDWEKGKLTNSEALRNLGEFVHLSEDLGELEHYLELEERLKEANETSKK